MVVVDPFNLDVVRQPRLAVHVGRQAVLRVEEVGVRPLQPERARHGDHEPLKVAVEPERHLLQMHGLDHAARVGAVGLQQRALADHRDRFFDGADLHLQVDPHGRVHRDDHAVANRLLEAGQLARHAVGAVFQVREDIEAALVRHGGVGDVRARFGDCDARTRHRKPGFVADVAEQGSFHRLRIEPGRQRQGEYGREYEYQSPRHTARTSD